MVCLLYVCVYVCVALWSMACVVVCGVLLCLPWIRPVAFRVGACVVCWVVLAMETVGRWYCVVVAVRLVLLYVCDGTVSCVVVWVVCVMCGMLVVCGVVLLCVVLCCWCVFGLWSVDGCCYCVWFVCLRLMCLYCVVFDVIECVYVELVLVL